MTKNRAYAVRTAVSLLASISAVACALGTEQAGSQTESSAQTSEAITKVGAGPIATTVRPPPPPPPPPALAFPPANASYCPTVQPRCSATSDGARRPALVTLGCSDEFHWYSGNNAGLLGGIVTLCPDTDAVRAQLPTLGSPVVNTCSACIPQAPAGEIYVLLEGFIGPNCESGCLGHRIGQVGTVDDGVGVGN